MTAKTVHQGEAALRAALTTLMERWTEHADSLPLDPADASELGVLRGERIRMYRLMVRDLGDVLRTGHVPHDLMTDAELEQYGTPERKS